MNTYSRATLVHIVNEDKPFLASLKSFMCEMYLNAKNRLFYMTCRVVIETENSVGIEAPRSKSQIIISQGYFARSDWFFSGLKNPVMLTGIMGYC